MRGEKENCVCDPGEVCRRCATPARNVSANEKDADGRHVCTKDNPWSPEKSERAVHPDASTYGDGCYEGCCDDFRCPNCGVEWRKEYPQ